MTSHQVPSPLTLSFLPLKYHLKRNPHVTGPFGNQYRNLYLTSMPRERTSDGIANVIKYVLDHLSISFDQTMIYDMTLNCLIRVA